MPYQSPPKLKLNTLLCGAVLSEENFFRLMQLALLKFFAPLTQRKDR